MHVNIILMIRCKVTVKIRRSNSNHLHWLRCLTLKVTTKPFIYTFIHFFIHSFAIFSSWDCFKWHRLCKSIKLIWIKRSEKEVITHNGPLDPPPQKKTKKKNQINKTTLPKKKHTYKKLQKNPYAIGML